MTDRRRWVQRLVLFLTSAVIILAELALMRELALRFWEHLAWLAICIGLLGFGISGTVLILVHRFLRIHRQTLQYYALIGLGLSLPASVRLADTIELNLIQMVWQPTMMLGIGKLELVLGIPFLFGGMFIGLALEDQPDSVGGHYAANFLGSAVGGLAALPLMFVISPRLLILLGGCTVLAGSLLLVQRLPQLAAWMIAVLVMSIQLFLVPHAPRISEDKDIVQIKAMADSKTVTRRYSPQGMIELMEAPAYHTAPGVALNYARALPQQTLIVIDGQVTGSLYAISSVHDYEFMDHTTMALPYAMGPVEKVLIDHDPGAAQLGLALIHGVEDIRAVTGNWLFMKLMNSTLDMTGTNTYIADQVTLVTGTLREQLRKSSNNYPLIVLPTVGKDPGGLSATEPDTRMTIETMRLCFLHLRQDGLLSVSTAAYQPPRESLRLLNLFVELLHENKLDPAAHLAMIRSWSTVTIVATKSPLTPDQLATTRLFCRNRGFDLVWLPDLNEEETNIFHQLEADVFFHGAKSLVGEERNRFVDEYFYKLAPPNDNKPFFRHFNRWPTGDKQLRNVGRYGRTYVEVGSLLLTAALIQALLLALIFIVLPLIPVIGLPGGRTDQLTVLGFFSSLGCGFMLLEIGLLQRLTVYLAHPVWASATVLSGFMLFGGIGSSISSVIHNRLPQIHLRITGTVVAVAIMLLPGIDWMSGWTEGFALTGRITVAYLFIAPLATVMGMVFPLGLRRLGMAQPHLIPWAWSANGFTSVLGTLLAQVFAMRWGFDTVVWLAIGCYALAAMCSQKLPEDQTLKAQRLC
ncbi:hypothetical protein [Desulfopila sp. IMCC35008]|uniref:hypothetical protein n=1 Tax=Desulfopila sp. IMCC35008 TaxID=2653858 RepID=UPI0013D7699E|nr:hypothetical protein [Desulfopila sp. IMCC35008]